LLDEQIIGPLLGILYAVWGQCATLSSYNSHKLNTSPAIQSRTCDFKCSRDCSKWCTAHRLLNTNSIKNYIKDLSISFFSNLHKANNPQHFGLTMPILTDAADSNKVVLTTFYISSFTFTYYCKYNLFCIIE